MEPGPRIGSQWPCAPVLYETVPAAGEDHGSFQQPWLFTRLVLAGNRQSLILTNIFESTRFFELGCHVGFQGDTYIASHLLSSDTRVGFLEVW